MEGSSSTMAAPAWGLLEEEEEDGGDAEARVSWEGIWGGVCVVVWQFGDGWVSLSWPVSPPAEMPVHGWQCQDEIPHQSLLPPRGRQGSGLSGPAEPVWHVELTGVADE